MATVSRGLPRQPHLDVPKREARALLTEWRNGRPDALERVRHRHPKYPDAAAATAAAGSCKLADAQLVVAREYGYASWPELKRRIEAHPAAVTLQQAIRADDLAQVQQVLRAHPESLHVPLWNGNWGPPMSHAANLGRLRLVQTISVLGARDHQHAFERAVLQGQIECARWLHAQGVALKPGIILGSCETLSLAGFQFLCEIGAPLTDERGTTLGAVGLVVGTYGRHPSAKHAMLELFARHGVELPDTPMGAVHRGDLPRLREFLRRDPGLLRGRFRLREIYPPELGCGDHADARMHWTPLDGTTLLHIAIDFQEREIFDWLLAEGAEVDARASVDPEGFGDHPPLFNAVVNGMDRDPYFARALLARGADPKLRASVRKFLDWRESPRWHLARDVTAEEWGRGFPDQSWVNPAALQAIGAATTNR